MVTISIKFSFHKGNKFQSATQKLGRNCKCAEASLFMFFFLLLFYVSFIVEFGLFVFLPYVVNKHNVTMCYPLQAHRICEWQYLFFKTAIKIWLTPPVAEGEGSMRRWVSCFPKALLEVKEIAGTRHAIGQRKDCMWN